MNYSKNINGFSLLEVLISMVIFSLGILGLASISTTVMRGNSLISFKTGGSTLATDKIEELVSLDFTDPQLTNDGTDGDLSETANPDHILANPDTAYAVGDAYPSNTKVNPAGVAAMSDSDYTIFWNIEDTTATLKTVAVYVTWSDLFGSHTYFVTTQISA